MKQVGVGFRKLDEKATIPSYAHEGDAGMDLYYVGDPVAIIPKGVALLGTGLAMILPLGYVGLIHPRSGLALKKGLTVLNAPGTVDSGYRGEIKVILINHSIDVVEVEPGDRIAQLIIQEVVQAEVYVVNELDRTVRGTAGFGSTGA